LDTHQKVVISAEHCRPYWATGIARRARHNNNNNKTVKGTYRHYLFDMVKLVSSKTYTGKSMDKQADGQTDT